MILAFDTGNTLTKIAICNLDGIVQKIKIKTDPRRLADDYFHIIKTFYKDTDNIKSVVISSVVPDVTKNLKDLAEQNFNVKPFLVAPGIKTGIFITADNPNEVGSDIICNVAYSASKYDKGLIIDLGTANKYIYFKNSKLLGVAIMPGIELSLRALSDGTALIPEISFEVPKKILGLNTVSSCQGGAFYGLASEIEGMSERIKKETGEDLPIILSGGTVKIIEGILNLKYDYIEDLTLLGLLEIYKKNYKK